MGTTGTHGGDSWSPPPAEASDLAARRLAAIVESSDDAIIGKTLDGIVTSWNRGAERIYGWTAAEIIGRPVTTLAPPEQAAEIAAIMERLRRGERVDHYETVRCTRDGRRLDVSLTISPIHDRRGRVIGASTIARDITARKATERQLKELTERLESRVEERTAELRGMLDELDSMVGTVRHEVRAPLRQAAGFAEVVLEGGRLGPEDAAELRRIVTIARTACERVDALLDHARRVGAHVPVRRVSSRDLVEEVREQVELETGGRRVEWRIGALPDVSGDPELLRSVWLNLLSNAVKFTAPRERPVIEVGAEVREGAAHFHVRDNGVGFDPAEADRIFEPFSRFHAEFPGVGIGLSDVRRFVERHGGRAWAEVPREGGAVFRFTLPLANGDGAG